MMFVQIQGASYILFEQMSILNFLFTVKYKCSNLGLNLRMKTISNFNYH